MIILKNKNLFTSPFKKNNPLNNYQIKRLFINKRNEFVLLPKKNLKFFLRERYSFVSSFLKNKSKIIEIGSGAGLSKFFIEKDYITSDLIKNQWIDVQMNAEKIKFPNNYFDAIFTCDTILHFNDPKKFFNEVNRTLKNYGVLIINDINLSFLHLLFIKLFKHLSINKNINLFKKNNGFGNSAFHSNARNLDLLTNDINYFEKKFGLKLIHKSQHDFLLYLATGGISTNINTFPLPIGFLKVLRSIDSVLVRLAPDFFAFSKRLVFLKSKSNISNTYLKGFAEKKLIRQLLIEINNRKNINYLSKNYNIPIGNKKSYGDVSNLDNTITYDSKQFNRIIKINYKKNFLIADSGTSISTINRVINNKNYIIPVTGGFEDITLAGAVANNIHGKNFSKCGSFIEIIKWLKIIINGKSMIISQDQNKELFYATVGGIGLTGIITHVCIKIEKKISLNLLTTDCIYYNNLKFLKSLKEKSFECDYAYGIYNFSNLNKHILRYANFVDKPKSNINNRFLKFNFLKNYLLKFYFITSRSNFLRYINYIFIVFILFKKNKYKYLNNFLYQYNNNLSYLDVIQLHYVVNEKNTYKVLNKINQLNLKYKSKASLITVKYFNKKSGNFLSFPIQGYTFTFDFKNNYNNKILVNDLINIVIKYKGHIYLAKDSIMNRDQFAKVYDLKKFKKILNKYNCNKQISDASIRYGLKNF